MSYLSLASVWLRNLFHSLLLNAEDYEVRFLLRSAFHMKEISDPSFLFGILLYNLEGS